MNPIAIIQFPGSNTERETIMACDRVGMKSEEFLWNAPPSSLVKYSGYIIVGGFSYEDRSRAGIIAALDPIINQIKKESSKGKPVLGICNGAQILIESGLVPGCEDSNPCVSLTDNKRIKNNEIFNSSYFNFFIIKKCKRTKKNVIILKLVNSKPKNIDLIYPIA